MTVMYSVNKNAEKNKIQMELWRMQQAPLTLTSFLLTGLLRVKLSSQLTIHLQSGHPAHLSTSYQKHI